MPLLNPLPSLPHASKGIFHQAVANTSWVMATVVIIRLGGRSREAEPSSSPSRQHHAEGLDGGFDVDDLLS